MATYLEPPYRNAVVQILANCDFGDLIELDKLHAWLGIERPVGNIAWQDWQAWQLKCLNEITDLKSVLLEDHAMMLVAENGKGYRILKPQEQTGYAVRDSQRAIAKILRKRRAQVMNVRREGLTSEQQRENTDAIIRTAAIEQAMKQIPRGNLPSYPRRLRRDGDKEP